MTFSSSSGEYHKQVFYCFLFEVFFVSNDEDTTEFIPKNFASTEGKKFRCCFFFCLLEIIFVEGQIGLLHSPVLVVLFFQVHKIASLKKKGSPPIQRNWTKENSSSSQILFLFCHSVTFKIKANIGGWGGGRCVQASRLKGEGGQ